MMLNINCDSCNHIISKSVYKPIKSYRFMKLFCCEKCGLIFSKNSSPYISRPLPSMSCDANRSSIKYTKQLVLGDHIDFLKKNKINLSNYKSILDIGSNRGDFINHIINNALQNW